MGKKIRNRWFYFFDFASLVLELVLGFSSLTCFIGVPQQTISQSLHPQTSSTKTTMPHSLHLYFSPFFFAKYSPPKNTYTKIVFEETNFWITRVSGKTCESVSFCFISPSASHFVSFCFVMSRVSVSFHFWVGFESSSADRTRNVTWLNSSNRCLLRRWRA